MVNAGLGNPKRCFDCAALGNGRFRAKIARAALLSMTPAFLRRDGHFPCGVAAKKGVIPSDAARQR